MEVELGEDPMLVKNEARTKSRSQCPCLPGHWVLHLIFLSFLFPFFSLFVHRVPLTQRKLLLIFPVTWVG